MRPAWLPPADAPGTTQPAISQPMAFEPMRCDDAHERVDTQRLQSGWVSDDELRDMDAESELVAAYRFEVPLLRVGICAAAVAAVLAACGVIGGGT